MEQTVYIDLLFLINFSMDFLCFYITSRIISVRFLVGRSCLASALGGVYADAALFLPFGGWQSLVLDVAVCFIMCTIVYAKRSGLIFSSIVYFSVSMALGGFMTAIFNMLNKMGFSGAVVEDGDGISAWLFLFAALVSGIMTLFGGRFFKRSSSISTAEVEITYSGRTTRIRAFVDSGNLLRDPISGRACIVTNIDAVSSFFPQEIIRAARTGSVAMVALASASDACNVRLIPTKTASGERMLVALRPEKISVLSSKKKYEADAMIVLAELGRSAHNSDALIPCELIK